VPAAVPPVPRKLRKIDHRPADVGQRGDPDSQGQTSPRPTPTATGKKPAQASVGLFRPAGCRSRTLGQHADRASASSNPVGPRTSNGQRAEFCRERRLELQACRSLGGSSSDRGTVSRNNGSPAHPRLCPRCKPHVQRWHEHNGPLQTSIGRQTAPSFFFLPLEISHSKAAFSTTSLFLGIVRI